MSISTTVFTPHIPKILESEAASAHYMLGFVYVDMGCIEGVAPAADVVAPHKAMRCEEYRIIFMIMYLSLSIPVSVLNILVFFISLPHNKGPDR